MKVDLNKPIKNLKGEAVKDSATMGEILADRMAGSSNVGDSIKWLTWAIDLSNGKPIEVDKSDINKIKDFLQKPEYFNVLVAGRILEAIEEQEAK